MAPASLFVVSLRQVVRCGVRRQSAALPSQPTSLPKWIDQRLLNFIAEHDIKSLGPTGGPAVVRNAKLRNLKRPQEKNPAQRKVLQGSADQFATLRDRKTTRTGFADMPQNAEQTALSENGGQPGCQ